MRISDWSSDVCSSDLYGEARAQGVQLQAQGEPVIPDPRCLESVRVFRSSDVHLAADVAIKEAQHLRVQVQPVLLVVIAVHFARLDNHSFRRIAGLDEGLLHQFSLLGWSALIAGADRKSVVSGKSVSVRVDLGGRRILKK